LSCINDTAISQIANASITKLYGDNTVAKFDKTLGGEDFAYFNQKVPGVMALVGGGNKEKNAAYPHHHEKFNIDEDALPIGVSLYAQFAIDFLNK